MKSEPVREMSRRRFGAALPAAGAAVLAACGAQGAPTEKSPIEGIQPGGKIAWGFWSSSQEAADSALTRLESFRARYPGVEVEANFGPSGEPYRTKMIALISAGTPPDLMQVDAYWMPDFIKQGLVQRLDSYLKGDRRFSLDGLLPGVSQDGIHQVGGIHYALPAGAESPRVLFYNQQRFEESGLPLPNTLDDQGKWTWDAYQDTVTRLSKGNSPERYFGTRAYLGVRPEPFTWIASNGGKTFSDDLKNCLIDQPDAVAALQFQADLIHRQRAAPGPGEELGAGNAFVTGRVAMFMSGIWQVAPLQTAAATVGLRYGIAPVPKSPKGTRKTVAKPNAYTIPTGVSGQKAATAWALGTYFLGPDNQKDLIDRGNMTALKSQLDLFLATSPTPNAKVVVDAYQRKEVVPVPIITQWTELEEIVNEEFNKVQRGESSVQVAASATKARVNALLKS